MAVTKILIQTVGTGGPANPVWEALAFAVRRCRPDVLVQWCSRTSNDQTVPKFEQALGEAQRPRDVRRSICTDEDDVNALAGQYLREMDALSKEFPEARLELDFTSGTKPMSVAAAAAAVARRIPQLHYAVGPRDESGRARSTSDLKSVSPAALSADRSLQELGLLFNRGQFAAVAVQAEGLLRNLDKSDLQKRARSLQFLAEAYSDWDRFDWGAAFSKLRDYRRIEETLAEWDTTIIGRQVPYLKSCKNSIHGAERLADLLANTDRCIAQGRFDDAVARLYRLVEYIGQVRFANLVKRQKDTNPTSAVPLTMIAPLAPATTTRITPKARNGKVDLGLGDTIYVLAEAGDVIGRSMKTRYDPAGDGARNPDGPLARLLTSRNQSLLAHGASPVGGKVAADLRDTAAALLEEHLEAEKRPMKDVMECAVFLKCPWVAE